MRQEFHVGESRERHAHVPCHGGKHVSAVTWHVARGTWHVSACLPVVAGRLVAIRLRGVGGTARPGLTMIQPQILAIG
jgi:hypothetical protein